MSADAELALHLINTTADELVRLHLQEPEKYSRERLLAHAERMAQTSGLLGREKSKAQHES